MSTEKLQGYHIILTDVKDILVTVRDSPLLIVSISIVILGSIFLVIFFNYKGKNRNEDNLLKAVKVGEEYRLELNKFLITIKEFLQNFKEEILRKLT